MNEIVNLKNCPLCSSNDFSLIKEMKYPEGILRVSRCNNCSISFSSTRFTDEYLHLKYYSKNYEEEIVGSVDYEKISKRFFWGIVDKIMKLKKDGRWLDIGCGKGYLLDVVSKNEFKCYGIDIKNEFIDNKEITFFNKSIFECDFGGVKFDVISMINVLDHIGFPAKYLRKAYDLLNPSGILYIHVPNEHYFGEKMFGSVYSPNVHLVNYSEKNIESVLKRFGFSKVEFVPPMFKYRKDKKAMMLIYLLEVFNKLSFVFNKGVWVSMQVIAHK